MINELIQWWKELHAERLIRPGDIYEDCSYHPVRCTENFRGELVGVSLIDGSSPRSCSMFHCGVVKLSEAEAQQIVENWSDEYIERMNEYWKGE